MRKTRREIFILMVAVVMLSLWFTKWAPELGAIHASASGPTPMPNAIFLPLVVKNYPLQTVFGAEMASITSSGGLNQMVAANTTWVRRNALLWSDVSPDNSSERNWSAPSVASLEQELINVSSKGLQVILIVRSTPTWAQKVSGSYCGPILSQNLPDFASFMHDAVARYSVPPYNVKYWEIWNEPDIGAYVDSPPSLYGCWGNPDDPTGYYGGGYYAQMLQTVYPQIKAANQNAQVLVGGLLLDCDPNSSCAAVGHSPLPPKFLEGILRNGGSAYFNGVSFHAYDYYMGQPGQYSNANWNSTWNTTGPVSIAKANFLMNLLTSYTVTGKFLMNTESAIICGSCSSDSTFETTKAYYAAQVYAVAIALGLRANDWYSVLGWLNSGLLNADLTPRPAYTAFQFARSKLCAPTFIGSIISTDVGTTGVTGYKFNRDGRSIWVLWSLDGNTHNATFPSTPLAVWDALGNSVTPVASTMAIGLNPLYVDLP